MKFNWAGRVSRGLRQEAGKEELAMLFHENTKLFPKMVRQQPLQYAMSPFELYLSTRSFRQYRESECIPLPEIRHSYKGLQEMMFNRRSRREVGKEFSLSQLATVLGQALGPTQIDHNEQYGFDQALRAWPSAGALYPLDAYLIVRKIHGIQSGIYHYNVICHHLERLTSRHVDEVVREGFMWQRWIMDGAVILLFVASFDRTLSKYGDRGYRFVFLDAGHAAQNILLVAEQEGLQACALGGFCDKVLAEDLRIDGVYEAVVYAIVMGGANG